MVGQPGLLLMLSVFSVESRMGRSELYDLLKAAIWAHFWCNGDVARVNGQLAVSRAFGDKNLKTHLRSDPDVQNADVDSDTEFLVLASDGLWKVMANQEVVDIARKTKDPQKAAKQLAAEALNRDSKDDISIIVVRFMG
uniref:PPM-type phosphatase domain-containing protein n=1 Tax=Quercus lobata TaxID=97700 RepID=A0A7N2RDA8_QUELO